MSDGEEGGCGGWVWCFKTKRFYKWRTHTHIFQRRMDTKPADRQKFYVQDSISFFSTTIGTLYNNHILYSILRDQNYCIPQYSDEIPTEHISTDLYLFLLWIFSPLRGNFPRSLLLYFIVLHHRSNMESKVYLASCVQRHSSAETPQPPLSPHLGSYTRALLVSQDRRHLFLTPWFTRTAETSLFLGFQTVQEITKSACFTGM